MLKDGYIWEKQSYHNIEGGGGGDNIYLAKENIHLNLVTKYSVICLEEEITYIRMEEGNI